MQVIIPMSGVGQRFQNAGYTTLKPFIKINDKTIIEHVIDLFDTKDDFIFIVNEDHLRITDLEKIILSKTPKAIIVAIKSHKLGPVFAVQQAAQYIKDDHPCIVNYCDFSMEWDYKKFCEKVIALECDGAIPCYSGFHPHLLHQHNVYAGCRVDANNMLLEIKEKHSFTIDKSKSHHSTGTYYFKTGALLKYYVDNLIASNHHLNGEFYASMLYEQVLKDGKTVYVFDNITHFCQWGTPEDLEEYLWWQDLFLYSKTNLKVNFKSETNILMPMAGNGQRFIDECYLTPKPYIEIDNKPMFLNALQYLPIANQNIFITKSDLKVDTLPKGSKCIVVNETTLGQASTCLLAEDYIDNDTSLLITPCDNGMLYDIEAFFEVQQKADVIVFSFRNTYTVTNNPNAYGWVVVDKNDNVKRISCKIALSNEPKKDHAITGAFWFKKGSYFVKAAKEMIDAKRTINGEYYVDECINDCIAKGLTVKVFEIDKYICWGTPNDLKTYFYWQSFFK